MNSGFLPHSPSILSEAIMSDFRITEHPVLPDNKSEEITVFFQDRSIKAKQGETISSALFANGIHTFGHHHKDHSPQGIFCANGQCSQCMVMADGSPVKACVTLVKPNMKISPMNALPALLQNSSSLSFQATPEINIPVLILGGGPAGLSAAEELGRSGISCILVDDKHRLGGKLVLQTHKFFGSIDTVHAGTRGIDIATILEKQVRELENVQCWTSSTAIGVFSDKKVGILKEDNTYVLVKPEVLLITTGAREKALSFKGNTLPGVYGAGAFQTLVNRDLVKPSKRLFIIGGGNVGLIAGYHALQADIEVVGLVEAAPQCGGYKVHKDKLVRLGVPVMTSHTVLQAHGDEHVEGVTTCKLDSSFQPIKGTEKYYACDTLLVAVGLDPVNEFYLKAKEFEMQAFVAGDADEIAEASAAIFSGRIKGREISSLFSNTKKEIPAEWTNIAEILKSRPGETLKREVTARETGIIPIFHCDQEIPCNPCTSVCPMGLIQIDSSDIRMLPRHTGEESKEECIGCEKCVKICPGLAITLVDYRKNHHEPTVTMAYELDVEHLEAGNALMLKDRDGNDLGQGVLEQVKTSSKTKTSILKIRVPAQYAKMAAGVRAQNPEICAPTDAFTRNLENDAIVCRCERVTAGEIRALIQQGFRDINAIKVISRAGMGACGGKTCTSLIYRIFKEEGIPESEYIQGTDRPPFVETSLAAFAGVESKE
jgi:NADPH-dependent 2,4-dienoyl-CoA reductase/sulfur reductase-like enzyme/Fe-S-cluster-containing hydrogenase component 2/bacterioferritin-associated ferredoxin